MILDTKTRRQEDREKQLFKTISVHEEKCALEESAFDEHAFS